MLKSFLYKLNHAMSVADIVCGEASRYAICELEILNASIKAETDRLQIAVDKLAEEKSLNPER